MGGPAAIVYLPKELSGPERQSVDQLMADRSWRRCPEDHDVMTFHIESMSFEHEPSDVDELESLAGWRPVQQIQLVCHGKSLIEYHKDMAAAAARLARHFDGVVLVFADNRYFVEIVETSLLLNDSEIGDASERLVGPEWLEQFAKMAEPRFRK